MPSIERRVLTAKSRSKNLREHEEAFKSVNGFVTIPPADPNSEISGVIAELLQFSILTRKECAAAAYRIRDLSGKKIKFLQAYTMIFKALGHPDIANSTPWDENENVKNLNFERKDLAAINNEITIDDARKRQEILDTYKPYMDLMDTLPDDSEFMSQWRLVRPTGQVLDIARQFAARHNLPYTEYTPELWLFAVVLSCRYRTIAAANTRKSMGRLKGHSKLRCTEILREYTVSIHGEWWLKPGNDEESDDLRIPESSEKV